MCCTHTGCGCRRRPSCTSAAGLIVLYCSEHVFFLFNFRQFDVLAFEKLVRDSLSLSLSPLPLLSLPPSLSSPSLSPSPLPSPFLRTPPLHTQRLVRILPRIYGLLCALIESSNSDIRAVLAHLFLQRIGPTLGVALPPNAHLASGAASSASTTAI